MQSFARHIATVCSLLLGAAAAMIAVRSAGGKPAPSDCRVAPEACAFATRLDAWLRSGNHAAVASLLRLEEYECPGPAPMGLGGPYPLCDDSVPGEPRLGAEIIGLQSEGGVGSREFFRDLLGRDSGYEAAAGASAGLQRVTIGCPGIVEPGPDACRDGFALVYATPPPGDQGGGRFRAVRVFPVLRTREGYRLATIIFAADALVPREALHGGHVSDTPAFSPGVLVPGEGASTFFPWFPTAISLPSAGSGRPEADKTVTAVPVLAAFLFGGGLLVLAAWTARRSGAGRRS